MEQFTNWLQELLLYVPKKIWEWLTGALATALEAIPVPDWMANAGGAFSAIPPGVIWFANQIHLPAGIAIVLSAYAIRFLIRRIPIIG